MRTVTTHAEIFRHLCSHVHLVCIAHTLKRTHIHNYTNKFVHTKCRTLARWYSKVIVQKLSHTFRHTENSYHTYFHPTHSAPTHTSHTLIYICTNYPSHPTQKRWEGAHAHNSKSKQFISERERKRQRHRETDRQTGTETDRELSLIHISEPTRR